jgi:hypothetical protein
MNTIPVDVIKEITRYLDICCDDPAFAIYHLTEAERADVVSYWRAKSLIVKVSDNGTICYRVNGLLHNFDGLPAVITEGGDKYWYFKGIRHRLEGPTIERADGYTEWCTNGSLHRINGPAVSCAMTGSYEWWRHGKRHRDNDLPAVKRVWRVGVYTCEWWVNGIRHRDNGPAVESPDGYNEIWINGIHKI